MSDDLFNTGQWRDHLHQTSEPTRRYEGERGPAFSAWQRAFREDLRAVLGHDVIRENAPNDADSRRVGTEEREEYERQEWVVRTETGVLVPFYLLLPSEPEPPHPVVFTIHGHNKTGKDLAAGKYSGDKPPKEIAEERRDMALQAVERGYAAVAPDMRAFGVLADSRVTQEGDRACTNLQKTAQLYGRSLAGERVWDVLRLVDFVEQRPGLDSDRVAITGHSGGGAVTLFAAALDERLSPVAPNAYFCTFRDSIVAIDHCECNYIPGLLRLGEMWDLAGLIAPRPLGITTGEHDSIFPVEGTRRAFERLQDIYTAVDAADQCELYVSDGGHEFHSEGVWPFIERTL